MRPPSSPSCNTTSPLHLHYPHPPTPLFSLPSPITPPPTPKEHKKRKPPTHPKKRSHRLIRTPNLHLPHRRLHAIAVAHRALLLRLIRIIPHTRPAKHILFLLALERFPVVDRFLQYVLIRTGQALQTVQTGVLGGGGGGDGRGGDGEDIAAGGTDWGEGGGLVWVVEGGGEDWEERRGSVQSSILKKGGLRRISISFAVITSYLYPSSPDFKNQASKNQKRSQALPSFHKTFPSKSQQKNKIKNPQPCAPNFTPNQSASHPPISNTHPLFLAPLCNCVACAGLKFM
ncbi:hypothetical protein CJF31_00004782 [Rutstroemia sp. NJR-2017a BVV2]|nr:hypothetical protein CJF31_00004782 [Rutstroemia sp. NJR-2017a BVV2]